MVVKKEAPAFGILINIFDDPEPEHKLFANFDERRLTRCSDLVLFEIKDV